MCYISQNTVQREDWFYLIFCPTEKFYGWALIEDISMWVVLAGALGRAEIKICWPINPGILWYYLLIYARLLTKKKPSLFYIKFPAPQPLRSLQRPKNNDLRLAHFFIKIMCK